MIPLFVFLGAGLGGVARYAVGLRFQVEGNVFPWPTFLVNVSGSLILGLLYTLLGTANGSPETRAFLGIGFCGGYTTFSAFSYETARMLDSGEWNRAGVYAIMSVVACVIATFAGFRLGTLIQGD